MQPNRPDRSRSRGSALFMILMAVALFAALAFTFSRGLQQGSESLSDRQAELAASDILGFASKTERTLGKMLQGQRSETEISFEGLTGTYSNAACAADACKVFAAGGGGITPIYPVLRWLDSTQSGQPFYGTWYVTARICVPGIGTSACVGSSGTDLLMVLPYVRQNLCEKINLKLGIAAPIPSPSSFGTIDNGGRFNGSFAPGGLTLWDDAATSGRSSGCVADTGNNTHHFYQVLIVR